MDVRGRRAHEVYDRKGGINGGIQYSHGGAAGVCCISFSQHSRLPQGGLEALWLATMVVCSFLVLHLLIFTM